MSNMPMVPNHSPLFEEQDKQGRMLQWLCNSIQDIDGRNCCLFGANSWMGKMRMWMMRWLVKVLYRTLKCLRFKSMPYMIHEAHKL